MTVYFCNESVIDLNVIRIMGVSVKETNNPIGYFGTGLKFALATLLRTGHKVRLQAGEERFDFTVRDTEIRGEIFGQIFMNDEALPFTTQLGRNWEVWQAYRELHSNALDEGGTITRTPMPGGTILSVTGEGIEEAFAARGEIFIHTKPLAKVDGRLEVHPGPSRFIYYRGVRAGVLPGKSESFFTYNILSNMRLTEDRTLASMWEVEYTLETVMPSIDNKEVADGLLSGSKFWDQNLNFSVCGSPSERFLDAAEQAVSDTHCNEHARKMVAERRQRVQAYPPCALDPEEARLINLALEALQRCLDVDLTLDDITVTETLGAGVYGLYHVEQDRVYLARQSLDNGMQFVATTLYEEWLHRKHRMKDETRAMQQFLLDRLVSIALRGEL